MINYSVTRPSEEQIQKAYIEALIKVRPGLGEKSEKIASDLIETGLSPSEALMLINLVYSPTTTDGRGQATRFKHFAVALQERYGEVYLHNIGQNIDSFRGFLGRIRDVVEMRDAINEQLGTRQTFSFRDAVLFQELGLETEQILGYVSRLESEGGKSRLAAVMRVKETARQIEKGKAINLEALLFPEEMDSFVEKILIGDNEDNYHPINLLGEEND